MKDKHSFILRVSVFCMIAAPFLASSIMGITHRHTKAKNIIVLCATILVMLLSLIFICDYLLDSKYKANTSTKDKKFDLISNVSKCTGAAFMVIACAIGVTNSHNKTLLFTMHLCAAIGCFLFVVPIALEYGRDWNRIKNHCAHDNDFSKDLGGDITHITPSEVKWALFARTFSLCGFSISLVHSIVTMCAEEHHDELLCDILCLCFSVSFFACSSTRVMHSVATQCFAEKKQCVSGEIDALPVFGRQTSIQ